MSLYRRSKVARPPKPNLHDFQRGEKLRYTGKRKKLVGLELTVAGDVQPSTRLIKVACLIADCRYWPTVHYSLLERIKP